MRMIWIVLAVALSLAGQSKLDVKEQAKNYEFLQPPFAAPLRSGAALPATCVVNELFFLTSAAPGNNIHVCHGTNQWAPQGSAGQANVSVSLQGSLVGTRPALNLQAGGGIVFHLADTGARIDVQISADSATQLTKASLQSGAALFCDSTEVSPGVHECGMTPVVGVYTRGMVIHWLPAVAVTGAATLNLDARGEKALKRRDGTSDLIAGDAPAGALTALWYDGTLWRLMQ